MLGLPGLGHALTTGHQDHRQEAPLHARRVLHRGEASQHLGDTVELMPTELPVHHRARKYGRTKYGADRFVNGFLDLLTVYFLHARGSSPLHFFGRVGTFLLVVGGGISLYFLIIWLAGQGLRVRPVLILGLVLIVLAIQFISLGLVAELVVAGHHPEQSYRVRERY